MAFDVAVFNDILGYYSDLLAKQGQLFIYMQRYSKDNKPFGNCARCFDDISHTITDSKCPVCYGTGFTKGYDDPVTGKNAPYQRVLGMVTSNAVFTDWQKTGPVSTEQDQLLYIQMPDGIQPAISDLIVDQDGFRYRVGTNVKSGNFYGKNLGFVITVFQQALDNIIYTVPIPDSNPSGNTPVHGTRVLVEVSAKAFGAVQDNIS